PAFGLVPVVGVFPLATSLDHAGPMARDVEGCVTLMRDLVPGFQVAALGSPRIAVTWGAAATMIGDSHQVAFPTAELVVPAFMREVADVHRDLYAENAELYGENIRG